MLGSATDDLDCIALLKQKWKHNQVFQIESSTLSEYVFHFQTPRIHQATIRVNHAIPLPENNPADNPSNS